MTDPSATDDYTRQTCIRSADGLHVRPCSLIAQAASVAPDPIIIGCGARTADASSMFDLMALGAEAGQPIVVSSTVRSQSCVDAIIVLFDTDFAEPDPTDA